MNWLGMDIGGANVKVADAGTFALIRSFALWRHPERLIQKLREILATCPPFTHLAVTMTGELADCFDSKQMGIECILNAVARSAEGKHQRVYLSDGRLVSPIVARQCPQLAAASNWHALASYCGRFLESGVGLLIDVGSTTTDVIPFDDRSPRSAGVTDTQRLRRHELVYTGVERSPVCAIVNRLPYRGEVSRVAQELFATTHDVYLLLGQLPEELRCTSTADGRPATKACARARLGRIICADATEVNHRDAVRLAEAVAQQQRESIAEAISDCCRALSESPSIIVISGKGEFLARQAVQAAGLSAPLISLAEALGPRVSTAATAHALASICAERAKGAPA